jgi:hypothetical protein
MSSTLHYGSSNENKEKEVFVCLSLVIITIFKCKIYKNAGTKAAKAKTVQNTTWLHQYKES